MNSYVKRIDESDLQRILEYNVKWMKLNPNFVPFAREDNFDDYLAWCDKCARGDEDGVFTYMYLAIASDEIVGTLNLNINPEVNRDIYLECGHIGYTIAPFARGNGYGTIFCHLLIEEAKKFNLQNILIVCDERNVGSSRVIEKNLGHLRGTILASGNGGLPKGELQRLYDINIDESLTKFGCDEDLDAYDYLRGLCNISRDNLELFTYNFSQNEALDNLQKFLLKVDDIQNIDDLKSLYQLIMSEFIIKNGFDFERCSEDIVSSGIILNSMDTGTLMATILREKKVPTIYVPSVFVKDKSINSLYAFLEIYIEGKWILADFMNGKVYLDYDYNNLSLPNGYYAFSKGLNSESMSVFTIGVNDRLKAYDDKIKKIFNNFDEEYLYST